MGISRRRLGRPSARLATARTRMGTWVKAASDQAVRACRMRYFFKEYGRKPLPASGLQEDDLGHNLQWGAPEAVARDLAAYLREDGEPTRDLPYADPADPRRVLIDGGAADIQVGAQGDCPGR